MSFAAWVSAVVSVLLVVGAIASAGRRIRIALLPDVTGAPAVLVAWASGVASAIALVQLLGACGLFRRWVLLVVAVVVIVLTRAPRGHRAVRRPRSARRALRPLDVVAGASVLLVSGVWWAYAWHSIRWGVTNPDSIDYDLPLALSYVQTHRIGPLHLVTPGSPTAYYPQAQIVEQGLGMALITRDLLAPVLTMVDVALAMLSSAVLCARIGRPRAGLLAAAVVAGLPIVVATQAGAAKDDMTLTAWGVTAVALLAHALPSTRSGAVDRRWLVPCGLALGMAADVKLTAAYTVVAAVVAFAVLVRREDRRSTWVLVPTAAVVGAFWYVRDIALVGSPLPSEKLGPLPHADFSLTDLEHRSIAQALVSTPHDVRRHFVPLLGEVLGVVWPLLLLLAVVGIVAGLAQLSRSPTRSPLPPFVSAVAAVTLAGYAVTPGTGGPVADPANIAVSNTRYASLGLLLALLALVVALAAAADRLPWAPAAVELLLAGLVLVEVVEPWRLIGPVPNRRRLVAAVGIALVLTAVVLVAVRLVRVLPAPARLGAAALVILIVATAGAPVARRIARDRYALASGYPALFATLARTSGLRVGVVGTAEKYPYAGTRLANRVVEIGTRTPHGGFEFPHSCAEAATDLAAAHVGVVVLGPVPPTGGPAVALADLVPLTTGPPIAVAGKRGMYRVAPDVGPASCR